MERDTRTDQRAGDTKLAVDAALAAAKETTAKFEAGFTKQIDSQQGIIDTKTANLDGQINDIKDRITELETKSSVSDPSTSSALQSMLLEIKSLQSSRAVSSGRKEGMTNAWGIIVGAAGIVGMVVTLIIFLSHNTDSDARARAIEAHGGNCKTGGAAPWICNASQSN